MPEKIPRSLIVIGSGAIGIEFASFYQTMGANVTVIEILPEIGFVIAMKCETTEMELINAVFPHPILSEMMHESVLDDYGRVIHL